MPVDDPQLLARLEAQRHRPGAGGTDPTPVPAPPPVEPDPAALALYRADRPPDPAGGAPPVRVGLAALSLAEPGDATIWLPTLARGLDPTRARLAGLCVLDPAGAAGRLTALLPTAAGSGALAALARCVDVLVLWEVGGAIAPFLPAAPDEPPAPRVVLVAHDAPTWPRHSAEAEAAEAVDAVLAVTRRVPGTVPEDRRAGVVALPVGVDLAALEPADGREAARVRVRTAWGLGPDDRVLGYLGRIGPTERVHYLVRALDALPARWRLVIAGDGPAGTVDDLRELAAPLGARVRRIGRDDLTPGDLLCALDACARPAVAEPFGLALAQALALGVPVVATPVGLIADRPELARVVPAAANPDAWARAVLADEEDEAGTRARGATARQVVSGEYDAAGAVRQWEAALVELGRRPANPEPGARNAEPGPAEPPPPPFARQLGSALGAAGRALGAAARGEPVRVPPAVQEARLRVCREGSGLATEQVRDGHCDQWLAGDRCAACGCRLSGVAGKSALATEDCPLHRWPT